MLKLISLTMIAAAVIGCSDEIDSDEEARRAYFGLDESIEKSLTLGFAGFNSASSANIAPQMSTGTDAGTLVITGQVDQGNSDNKGVRLHVGMVGYTDGPFRVDDVTLEITYETGADVAMQPALDLSLRNYPNGTLEGTLIGTYKMTGAIEGDAVLNLSFAGQTSDTGGGHVGRVPGTTTVTGTATSGDGTYEVNLTL